jgi:hypothetical protein
MSAVDRLHAWATAQPVLRVFTVVVRVLLALAFVPSGLVKIVGDPFTALPVADPVGQFFAGFFSAHGYYRFVGVAQWVAGGLLLFPRFATVGALLYLPIIVNIFAITVAIGPAFAGTRVVTGAMLAGNVYLLFWDWDRWNRMFPSAPSARARHGDLITSLATMLSAGVAFVGLTGVHLARLRQESFARPLAAIIAGLLLGVITLLSSYRRARR